MQVQPMYKNRWRELLFCAFVVALISLLINVQNPAGIVIITSLASTSLGLMIAPGSPTNSIRSVVLSYAFSIVVSVILGVFFSLYIDNAIDNESLLFFIKFFVMLLATLLLFGAFNAYHPPAIGAMLTYFIDTGFDDLWLIIHTPLAVIFLLATIKSYIYLSYSEEFKWKDFGKEFSKLHHHMSNEDFVKGANKKAQQIAKRLKKEAVDESIIQKVTMLSENEINNL